MTAIAYYISSHGFGHAARQSPVIRRLSQLGFAVHVRTLAPQKFFSDAASYHAQRYDIGLIQQDALSFDVENSLRWYADFLTQQAEIAQQEAEQLRQLGVRMVVGDMPPFAFEVAERLGVPSLAVTHFTWDWVYAHYIADFPQYAYLVDAIRDSYAKATLALQLDVPIAHPFDMFPHVQNVPILYNPTSETREEVRRKFAIPDDCRMALLSMGGHAWGNSDIRALRGLSDWVFLVMPGAWEQIQDDPHQFRLVPVDYPDYHNLIAAADVVVGKAGGSTVAEVIGHQTPMLYTTQANWREAQLLDETLRRYAVAQHVSQTDFEAGRWVDTFQDFIQGKHHWNALNAYDGVEQVVAHMLAMIK